MKKKIYITFSIVYKWLEIDLQQYGKEILTLARNMSPSHDVHVSYCSRKKKNKVMKNKLLDIMSHLGTARSSNEAAAEHLHLLSCLQTNSR